MCVCARVCVCLCVLVRVCDCICLRVCVFCTGSGWVPTQSINTRLFSRMLLSLLAIRGRGNEAPIYVHSLGYAYDESMRAHTCTRTRPARARVFAHLFPYSSPLGTGGWLSELSEVSSWESDVSAGASPVAARRLSTAEGTFSRVSHSLYHSFCDLHAPERS